MTKQPATPQTLDELTTILESGICPCCHTPAIATDLSGTTEGLEDLRSLFPGVPENHIRPGTENTVYLECDRHRWELYYSVESGFSAEG